MSPAWKSYRESPSDARSSRRSSSSERPCLSGVPDPRHHIFAVEHARAALDDEIVAGEIFREVRPAHNIHSKRLAEAFSQHPRNLFPSDVLPSAVHGYSTPRSVSWNGRSARQYAPPLHIVRQIALICRKQHGKGREHALRRFVFVDIAKYLGVRNDKLRCFFQYRKRRYQLIGRHTHNQAFLIEKFAQSLHLRQNQPSLGAWMSCGITRSTRSSRSTSVPVMRRLP